MRELVKVSTVCKMLNVSRSKVYSMVKGGAIPYQPIGKLVRFRLDELEAWLQAGCPSVDEFRGGRPVTPEPRTPERWADDDDDEIPVWTS